MLQLKDVAAISLWLHIMLKSSSRHRELEWVLYMKSRTSDTHLACGSIRHLHSFSILRGMLRTWELRAQSTDSGQGFDVMWHLMCFKENSYRMCLSSGEVFNCRRGEIKCNRSVFTLFNYDLSVHPWPLAPSYLLTYLYLTYNCQSVFA